MRKSPEACFKSADYDRNVFVGLSGSVAVYNDSSVGPFACLASGRIDVCFSSVFKYGEVVDHRVNITAVYEICKSGPAKAPEFLA